MIDPREDLAADQHRLDVQDQILPALELLAELAAMPSNRKNTTEGETP